MIEALVIPLAMTTSAFVAWVVAKTLDARDERRLRAREGRPALPGLERAAEIARWNASPRAARFGHAQCPYTFTVREAKLLAWNAGYPEVPPLPEIVEFRVALYGLKRAVADATPTLHIGRGPE